MTSNNQNYVSKKELTNVGLSLRSFFVETIIFENQTLYYEDKYGDQNFVATLSNSSIIVSKTHNSQSLDKSFSLYGIKFCTQYKISPYSTNSFIYNGSCILKK